MRVGGGGGGGVDVLNLGLMFETWLVVGVGGGGLHGEGVRVCVRAGIAQTHTSCCKG